MRLELAGYLPPLVPLVLTLTDGAEFDAASYVEMGYTNYDVMCIGAAGGQGSGVYRATSPFDFVPGGAGGGGGSMRVQGILDALPSLVDVTLGTPGADRTPLATSVWPTGALDGGDGGAASFGGTICRASGGKGGKKAVYAGFATSASGAGGDGGIGGSSTAGGAANHGTGGDTDGSPAPVAAVTGTWDGTIGKGGGGGGGGYATTASNPVFSASNASRGSYLAGDPSVYGPAGVTTIWNHPNTSTNLTNVTPGFGGGAKATPINGLSTVFGAKTRDADGNPVVGSGSGLVIIRLTVVV